MSHKKQPTETQIIHEERQPKPRPKEELDVNQKRLNDLNTLMQLKGRWPDDQKFYDELGKIAGVMSINSIEPDKMDKVIGKMTIRTEEMGY